jgi:hypothetical protein
MSAPHQTARPTAPKAARLVFKVMLVALLMG